MCELCQLVSSADNIFKQFGPRSGPKKVGPDLDPNCLTLMVFLKYFFEKVEFEKNNKQTADEYATFPSMQRVKSMIITIKYMQCLDLLRGFKCIKSTGLVSSIVVIGTYHTVPGYTGDFNLCDISIFT